MGVNEVVAGLAAENVNTPLGRLTLGTTEMPLRISGKPHDPAGYERMVIGRRGSDPIRLSDVATIDDTVEEQRTLALIDGAPAVAIDVTKQTQANTVGVVDAVRAAIDELRPQLPAGTEIQVVRDTSMFIRESVADVQNTLVIGGILTVLIVFCFLNSWRSTVITGLTLPISVISSFIVMYFLGMTLNTLTLMALSLAIGLLIDDAIVVRENIVRHLEHGQDHFTAAREGTAEIGLAVLATSMSIIAVFVPVAFMKGIIGRFFFQFGLTVAFSVLVSLFVSFTLDPMLSSRWHDPDIERKGRRNLLQRALDHFNAWFERMADGYKRVIGWSLHHRKTVVAMALAAFIGGLGVFTLLQAEFQPPMDQGEFMVKFKSAPGSSFAETRGRLEGVLKALAEFRQVDYSYGSIGAGDADTVRDAMVFVKLTGKEERGIRTRDFIHLARKRLEQVPGVVLSVQEDPDAFQKPLQIAIQGDDIATLKQYARQLKTELYAVPGIVDIEAGMDDDLPEYRLVVDRERAAASGLGSGALADTVAVLVGGQAVTTYEDSEGEAITVRVRLPQALRGDIRQVGDLKATVATQAGTALVPLSDMVTFTRASSPAEIGRRDLSRQLMVDANLDNLPLGTAGTLAMAAAERVEMAPGYKVVLGGDTEIMVESFTSLAEALLLAIIFVYLILAAQFESFIDPLSIMLSLPLSIVGMAGTLWLTGDTINIMSLIGLIMLMGLVTKNAILLIDYTKVLRRRGLDRHEALVTAGRTRLRPILMTTTAMIFGMLPLFFALGEGAEFRAPMARAVVGGLITSTMLTLIVVPVVYTILDDITEWLFRRRRADVAAAVVAVVASVLAACAAGGRAGRPAVTPRPDGRRPGARLPRPPPRCACSPSSRRSRLRRRRTRTSRRRSIQELGPGQVPRRAGVRAAASQRRWQPRADLRQQPEQAVQGLHARRRIGGQRHQHQRDLRRAPGCSQRRVHGVAGRVHVGAGRGGDPCGEARVRLQRPRLRRFRQAVARDVTTAYWNVLAARELVRIADDEGARSGRGTSTRRTGDRRPARPPTTTSSRRRWRSRTRSRR